MGDSGRDRHAACVTVVIGIAAVIGHLNGIGADNVVIKAWLRKIVGMDTHGA